MTVYVDDVRHAFKAFATARTMIMCHMWADTLDEMLAMADRIGVARKWIQGHPTLSFGKHRDASWVHFDISLGMKAKAVAAGAVLTDKYGPSEHTARMDVASADPVRIEIGARKLRQIEHIRMQQQLGAV